jgi:hypothetical protein
MAIELPDGTPVGPGRAIEATSAPAAELCVGSLDRGRRAGDEDGGL